MSALCRWGPRANPQAVISPDATGYTVQLADGEHAHFPTLALAFAWADPPDNMETPERYSLMGKREPPSTKPAQR